MAPQEGLEFARPPLVAGEPAPNPPRMDAGGVHRRRINSHPQRFFSEIFSHFRF